jgi:AraC-like DNA-binding protein
MPSSLLSTLSDLASHHFLKHSGPGMRLASPMPGLNLIQSHETSRFEATIYDPVICLILQGRKETSMAGKSVEFGAGESLIVSHSLPVESRIVEASHDRPYRAMILSIDTGLLRTLSHELDLTISNHRLARSLDVEATEEALISAMTRYLALANKSIETKIMAPLILKEIHFRLLMAPHGNMLRKLLEQNSYASQISRSILQITENFRTPLSVSSLAKENGMSESTFYKRFKQVTATTPLQYQKEIRLIEAQRKLRDGIHSVSSVAFDVGYESPTQFSREYSRKFGKTPRTEFLVAE